MDRVTVPARTLLLALALIAGLALPAHARQMVINAQAGATWSNYAFDGDVQFSDIEVNEESGRVGYALGGTLRFGGRLYFAPGLFYQSTGFQAVGTDTISLETIDETVGVGSVQVPVYIGYNLTGAADAGSTSTLGVRVYAGPSISWVTSVADNDLGLTKDSYASTIVGGVLGAGVDISTFTIDLNYEIGLTEVFSDDYTQGQDVAKQNILRGLVGLRF